MAKETDENTIVLVEHQSSAPIRLSTEERGTLRALVPGLILVESGEGPNSFCVNPGGKVGAVQVGDKRVVIRPKVAIKRLLFLLSYSMAPDRWRDLGFEFAEDDDLFEALIPGFAFQLETSLRHGLRSGYRAEEAALQTVRGRIRVADQIRTHFGMLPPVECTYDDFTDDILMNQILKAAIARLGAIRIRDARSRTRLRSLISRFANVSTVAFDPHRVPEVKYDRLNGHFRQPVDFARLILQSRSIDDDSGRIAGASFLVDLATVFEDFVVTALREALGLSRHAFPQECRGRKLFLDARQKLRLQPDLSWWAQDRCVFVGDVKYKKTPSAPGVKHPDLYQALAYTTATELSSGLLVYAAGEEVGQTFEIPAADKAIEVVTLDLDLDPADILAQIRRIAHVVRAQASAQMAAPTLPPPPNGEPLLVSAG